MNLGRKYTLFFSGHKEHVFSRIRLTVGRDLALSESAKTFQPLMD